MAIFRRSSTQDGGVTGQQYVELKWTARAKDTSSSVFLNGLYNPPTLALLEFTDNSINFRNRDANRPPTRVFVTIEKDKITVVDFGGSGGGIESVQRFTRIGETEDIGTSYRGAGAKYAAFFLAYDLELRSKPRDSDTEYTVTIDGFGDSKIDYSGAYPIQTSKSPFDTEKGRFEIAVSRIKRENNPNYPKQFLGLRRTLGAVYRPLLVSKNEDGSESIHRTVSDEEGRLRIIGDKINMVVSIGKRRAQILPIEVPLVEGYSEDDIKVVSTKNREKIWFWAGEMDLRNPKSRNLKPGIRFYFDGRLIDIITADSTRRIPLLLGWQARHILTTSRASRTNCR